MEKFIITDFTKKGKRENNEDSIYPNHEEDYPQGIVENLFLVCDGMGGHQKGEIASDMICSQMSKYFIDNKVEISDADTVKKAVTYVESKFDSYITEFEESAGMGSTMTMVHFHEKGATVAHVGDSRIYIFRDGKIVYKSKDHSLVQQLLDSGVLKSEDDARNHSEKNVILQAIRGASMKATKPDAKVITDLQENDIFLLCTDGVIESLTDAEIVEIFTTMPNIEAITAKIVRVCNENSSDNFSGILLQLLPEYINSLKIDEVEKLSVISNEKLKADNPKTMTRIVANSTEETSKAKEDLPDTKTQITEPTVPVENEPMLEESQLEKTQNFSIDNPNIEPQETTPKEETKEEAEKPIVQASPASDYQENKSSINIGNAPKSQVIPTRKEVANPIYESSTEENKPNFMKLLLFGIVGAVLAVVAYFFFNKKEKTEEQNIKEISKAISVIKKNEVRHTPAQSPTTTTSPQPTTPVIASTTNNNSSIQTKITENSATNTQIQIENKINEFEKFINQNKKNDAESSLSELYHLGIGQQKYNSLKHKFDQKFNTRTQSVVTPVGNTRKEEDIIKIKRELNRANPEADPKKANDLLEMYNKKYNNLQEYQDLKKRYENAKQ